MYNINPDAKHTCTRIGDEKTPLYIIDNLMLTPENVAKEAAKAGGFKAVTRTAFPGQRAPVNDEYKNTILNYILPILEKHYRIPSGKTIDTKNCFYSLIDRPENELSPFQCIPHIDSMQRYFFAITHYINAGDFGGTAIYKHVPTGFENIIALREKQYVHSVQHFLDTNGYPDKKYFRDSTEHFKLIKKIDYKPNRLVIYPGTLLHSAFIDPKKDLNNNVNTGRLTSNMFIEYI